jgi:hypothetical protein
MSVEQVTALLGQPRDRETIPAHGKTYDVVRYQTRFTGMRFSSRTVFIAPSDDDMTPFVFVNGN